MRVNRALHTAVHENAAQNPALQQVLLAKLSKAVEIVAPSVFDNACEGPSLNLDVRPEDVRMPGSSVPQRGSPAKLVKVAEVGNLAGAAPLSPGAPKPA